MTDNTTSPLKSLSDGTFTREQAEAVVMLRLKTIRERTFAWWFVRTEIWSGARGILNPVASTCSTVISGTMASVKRSNSKP